MVRTLVIVSLAAASTAFAQGPVPPMAAGQARPGGRVAQMLLANTGELGLTDAQVVRLAAIARRAETRRAALRSSMDSARQRFAPGQQVDTAARRQFRQRMQADMDKAVEAARVDQRDAIAVLNADQQAKAWDLVANRGRVGRAGGMPGGMRGGRGMGMREGRGPDMPRFREPRESMRDRPMRPRREFPDA